MICQFSLRMIAAFNIRLCVDVTFLHFSYSTVYTTAPVFSLVLDVDVGVDIALRYPELYKDLVKGRILSYKTFFLWLLISIYQGSVDVSSAYPI